MSDHDRSQFGTVTPYLLVDDPARLLDFLTEGLGAEVTERHETPDGKVMHAQARIGTSMVMAGGAGGEWKALSAMLYLYVDDCDASHARAVAAGGTSVHEPQDEEYGDRSAGVRGPCGNVWWFATPVSKA